MSNNRTWKQVGVFLSIICVLALGVSAVEPITTKNAGNLVSLAEIDEHRRAVYTVAWSPDGSMLASGSDDCTVQLIDTTTWEVVRRINGHTGAVWGVAWSPDGTRLASASSDGYVRIWDPSSGELMTEIPGSPLYSIAWTPSGDLLASGHSDGTVRILDPISGDELESWKGHGEVGFSGEVISLAWSPDGRVLASGGLDYLVRLWDREGNAIAVFNADTQQVRNDINGLAWSPDGRSLAAAGQAASVRIWDVEGECEIKALHTFHGEWMRGVAYSPSGNILATTGSDKGLSLWDSSDYRRLVMLRGHEAPVWSVAWSPDGSQLATGSGYYASGSGDTSVRIWEIP